MKSEKRKKELRCSEARIDGSEELSIIPDCTKLSIPFTGIASNQLYCHVLKKVDSTEEETVSIKESKLPRLR